MPRIIVQLSPTKVQLSIRMDACLVKRFYRYIDDIFIKQAQEITKSPVIDLFVLIVKLIKFFSFDM